MGDRFSFVFGWRGCYVIFHVKLQVFRPRSSHCFLGHVRAMFSFVMIWYYHVLVGFGIFSVLCLQPLRNHGRDYMEI
jgi:hypothetical protein